MLFFVFIYFFIFFYLFSFFPSNLVTIFCVCSLQILVERLEELGNRLGSHFSLPCHCLKYHKLEPKEREPLTDGQKYNPSPAGRLAKACWSPASASQLVCDQPLETRRCHIGAAAPRDQRSGQIINKFASVNVKL